MQLMQKKFSLLENESPAVKKLKLELAEIKTAHERERFSREHAKAKFNLAVPTASEWTCDMEKKLDLLRDIVIKMENMLECPISRELFSFPVVLSESGIAYEMERIKEHCQKINSAHVCPMTNIEISSSAERITQPDIKYPKAFIIAEIVGEWKRLNNLTEDLESLFQKKKPSASQSMKPLPRRRPNHP
jgi:hypothetical protein